MEKKLTIENKSDSEESESEQDMADNPSIDSGEADSSQTGNLHYLINVVYYSWIIEHVRFPEIVPKMILMRPIAGEVLARDREGKSKEAGILFMEFLKSKEDPGKYTCFLQALQDLNYTHIVKAIKGGEIKEQHEAHKRIIELFLDPLTEKMDPTLMANELLEKRVISSQEYEEIRNAESHQNTSIAAFILLDRIPRKSEDWYQIFLELLYKHGHHRLCKEIDPKVYDFLLANDPDPSEDLTTPEDLNRITLTPEDLALHLTDMGTNLFQSDIDIQYEDLTLPSPRNRSPPSPRDRTPLSHPSNLQGAVGDVSDYFIGQTKERSSDHAVIPGSSINNNSSLSVGRECNCSCGEKIEELKNVFETKVSVLESKIDHLTSLLEEMANK